MVQYFNVTMMTSLELTISVPMWRPYCQLLLHWYIYWIQSPSQVTSVVYLMLLVESWFWFYKAICTDPVVKKMREFSKSTDKRLSNLANIFLEVFVQFSVNIYTNLHVCMFSIGRCRKLNCMRNIIVLNNQACIHDWLYLFYFYFFWGWQPDSLFITCYNHCYGLCLSLSTTILYAV